MNIVSMGKVQTFHPNRCRAHSFGHFEKYVLLTARTFTSRLISTGSEKREVGRFLLSFGTIS
jgi:hypothetical protein